MSEGRFWLFDDCHIVWRRTENVKIVEMKTFVYKARLARGECN